MLVKINTVVIPGVNIDHVPMNCMAMIPVHDTPFENIKSPSKDEIHRIRSSIGSDINQMTHCSRCRADAYGKLGKR